jgi:hypothetical protein
LATIYIIKGRADTAKVFLGAMRKDVIEGPWAETCLARLEQDPGLSDDEEIGRLRSVMFQQDAIDTTRSDEKMLLDLLSQNKNNRMAFEYLMAHYLLTVEPGKLVTQVGRLNDFDYADIPALYAEAMAILAYKTAQPGADGRPLLGEAVRRIERAAQVALSDGKRAIKFKEAVRRIERAAQISNDAGDDLQKRDAALTAELPCSVARYFITGQSGSAK